MKFDYLNSPQMIFQINGPILALPKPITVRQFGEIFAEPSFQTEAASDDELRFLQIAYLRDNSALKKTMFYPVAFAGKKHDRLLGINQFGFGLPVPLGDDIQVDRKADFSALVDRLMQTSNRLENRFHAKRLEQSGRFIRVVFPKSPLHIWLDSNGVKISPQPERPEPLLASTTIIQLPSKARAEPLVPL